MKLASERDWSGQRGAVVIEATISLSIFMFFMFTMLTVVQIAYTQARVSVALDSVAKQMAEYSHVFFATGMNESFSGSGGKSSATANDVAQFLEELSGYVPGELGQYVKNAAGALKGDSITAYIEHILGGSILRGMLESELGDDFCHRNRIEGGFDTSRSKFLEGGKAVFFQVQYDVKVIQLFHINYVFHMSSCSYTQAWAGD